jgi:hypothetical protein
VGQGVIVQESNRKREKKRKRGEQQDLKQMKWDEK